MWHGAAQMVLNTPHHTLGVFSLQLNCPGGIYVEVGFQEPLWIWAQEILKLSIEIDDSMQES